MKVDPGAERHETGLSVRWDDMKVDPGAERHETGLSVRWDDMKVGFHGVPRARDADGGGTDGSWGN
jgi:hypothetical protein